MHLLHPVLFLLATALPFATHTNARAVSLDLAPKTSNDFKASGALVHHDNLARRFKIPDIRPSPHEEPVGPSVGPAPGAGIEAPASSVPGQNAVLDPLKPAGDTTPPGAPVSGPDAPGAPKGGSPPSTDSGSTAAKPAPAKPDPASGKPAPAPKSAPGSDPKSEPDGTKCKRADDIQNAICRQQQREDEVFDQKFAQGKTVQTELANAYKGSRAPPDWMQLDEKYTVSLDEDGKLSEAVYEAASKVLDTVGVKTADSKWQAVSVLSKKKALKGPAGIVIQAMSQTKETIIIAQRYSSRDANRAEGSHMGTDYLPVSELTWQAWSKQALGGTTKLRYIASQNIVNQETTDTLEASRRLIAALPRSKAETDYDQASLLPPGPLNKFSPQYRIFSAAEDADASMAKAFTGLLGTDNVRPIAKMLADHQANLALKKITKIHVFYDTLKKADYQMIVELA